MLQICPHLAFSGVVGAGCLELLRLSRIDPQLLYLIEQQRIKLFIPIIARRLPKAYCWLIEHWLRSVTVGEFGHAQPDDENVGVDVSTFESSAPIIYNPSVRHRAVADARGTVCYASGSLERRFQWRR